MADEEDHETPVFGGADAGVPDDGTGADESAGDALEFQPKVKVEQVDVKTLEEDEEVCFKRRSKLFVFVAEDVYGGEIRKNWWRERGTGDVKLLKHKEFGKVRLLMRQEKTLKICANHLVSPHVELKPNVGSDRSWVFTASDYADEELKTETFAIKFGSSENANDFRDALEQAKQVNAGTLPADAMAAIPDDGPEEGSRAAAANAAAASASSASAVDPEQAAIDAQIDKRNKLEQAEDVAEGAAERLGSAAPDAAVEGLASGVSGLGLAGGFKDADASSPEVQEAAAFAAAQLGKGALVKVAEAKQQVVAGMNFLMKLHIAHAEGTHAYTAKVFKPLPHEGKPMQLSEHAHIGAVQE